MEKQKRKRRTRAELDAAKEEARRLEAEGKSRKQIAMSLEMTASQVTRYLGAVRAWRNRRIVVA